MTPALRAAVIGVGYLGRIHAMKYKLLAGVELVAVVDSDESRLQQVSGELGVPGYQGIQELLGKVDVVSICTPTPSHHAIARWCLHAGIHCLVEKPVTVHLQEVDELIQLAQANKLVLQVGHLKRFHPVVTAMKAGGYLGQPRYIEAQRLAPFKPRSLDVDVVLDLMIHDVDLVLHFVDSEVEDVLAVGAPALTDRVDMANARLLFRNGCVASLTASRVANESTRRMRIFQNDSYLVLDFAEKNLQIMRRGDERQKLHGVEISSIEEIRPLVPVYDTLETQIGAFCHAVGHGLSSPVDGGQGRRALDVVIRIQDAINAFLRTNPSC
ncbi:MAG: Gfo/Idh/MocA family oxidoreductase [Magnetococcales bacterium]|nr:Gfo/Idh/MocA family oxidoreductase [Magnetococcales bacterium]